MPSFIVTGLNYAFYAALGFYLLLGIYFGSWRKGTNPARVTRGLHFLLAFAVVALVGIFESHWIAALVGVAGSLLTLLRVSRNPAPLKAPKTLPYSFR